MPNKQGAKKAARDKAYNATPEQLKRRAARNKARRLMIAKKGAAAVKSKDVDHKDGNPRNNNARNLRLLSKAKNRGRNNNK